MLPNIILVEASKLKTSPRLMKRGQGLEMKMAMEFNLIFVDELLEGILSIPGDPSPHRN